MYARRPTTKMPKMIKLNRRFIVGFFMIYPILRQYRYAKKVLLPLKRLHGICRKTYRLILEYFLQGLAICLFSSTSRARQTYFLVS